MQTQRSSRRGAAVRAAAVAITIATALAVAAPAVAVSGNDRWENATTLNGNAGRIRGNNVGATFDDGEFPSYYGDNSVWYRWTARQSGWVSFDTCLGWMAGTSFDTVIMAFDLWGDDLTGGFDGWRSDDAEDDDGNLLCGYASQVIMPVEAGTTYWLLVQGWRSENAGNFVLRWQYGASEADLMLSPCPRNGNFTRGCQFPRRPHLH